MILPEQDLYRSIIKDSKESIRYFSQQLTKYKKRKQQAENKLKQLLCN